MSVFSQPRLRLPDQVSIDFGPAPLLGRTFLTLDRAVRQQGIYLSISHDLNELLRINEQNRKDWYPLAPMFDPTLGDINPDNSFWIGGLNEKGEVVVAQAARLYLWPDTSMTDELESMRFYYPQPETQVGEHEGCVVETTATANIFGRVCYTGALWFRPDYRGLGLASIMPRITRAYALTKWYPDYMASLIKAKSVMDPRTVQRLYGWRNVEKSVRWRGSREAGAELEFAVVWMDQSETTDDLHQFNSLVDEDTRLGALV